MVKRQYVSWKDFPGLVTQRTLLQFQLLHTDGEYLRYIFPDTLSEPLHKRLISLYSGYESGETCDRDFVHRKDAFLMLHLGQEMQWALAV